MYKISSRYFQLIVLSFVFVVLLPDLVQAANTWQEPTCDPTDDPTVCNISPPLNVSSATQTKQGGLTIFGLLDANAGFKLTSGALTLPNDSITDAFVKDDITTTNYVKRSGDTMTGSLGINMPATALASTALSIAPYTGSTAHAVTIKGSTTQSLLSLQSDDNTTITEGTALNIVVAPNSSSVGLNINSSAARTNAYPINITLNADSTAARGISVVNNITENLSNHIALYGYSGGSTTGIGVFGYGVSHGVQGQSSGSYGVYGITTAANKAGVYGSNTASGGYGVAGYGADRGVYGSTVSGYGVYGTTSTLNKAGVYGTVIGGASGIGVQGTVTAGYGGYFSGPTGVSGVGGGVGVDGQGSVYGVKGKSTISSGYGVYGEGGTYGVYGTGNYGVYGNSTTSYGGYFSGPTGIKVLANNGNGIEAYSSTAVKAGVYGESTGTTGGYGVYGATNSTDNLKAAVYGLNTSNTAGTYGNGGYFKGTIGVTGETTGVDQLSYGVNGHASGDNAVAVHGLSDALVAGVGVWGEANSSTGVGVWGVAKSGTGVYGKGRYLAGKFDGAVAAEQFLTTEQEHSNLESPLISSDAMSVNLPFFDTLHDIVFDGATLWLLTSTKTHYPEEDIETCTLEEWPPAGGAPPHSTPPPPECTNGIVEAYDEYDVDILRYDPQDFAYIPSASFGIGYLHPEALQWVSNFAPARLAGNEGMLFFSGQYNPDDGRYQTTSILMNAQFGNKPFADMASDTVGKRVTTSAYIGGNTYLIGTGTNPKTGVVDNKVYLTNTARTAMSYKLTLDGTPLKFILNNNLIPYVLVDVANGADELVELNDAFGVSKKYFLKYTNPYYRSAKNITYDGKYFWITMANSSGASSLVKVDPTLPTTDSAAVTEYSDIYTVGVCTYINSITFDDQLLWVACGQGSGVTGKLMRVSPITGKPEPYKSTTNYAINLPTEQVAVSDLLFDGTYIIVATSDNKSSPTRKLLKYYSGHGSGVYGRLEVYRGINVTAGGKASCFGTSSSSPCSSSTVLTNP